MYISRMPINTARPGAARLVGSPYRMHAAVEQAFPPQAVQDATNAEGDEGRILWRLDSSAYNRSALYLYIVSPEKPDLTHIVEQAGWPEDPRWETKDYTPLLDRIQSGQVWNFRLKANTVRKALVDKGRTPREGVVGSLRGDVTPEQKVEWLARRCDTHGFSLAEAQGGEAAVRVSQSRKESFKRGGKDVTLSTAVFDGVLQVEDADLFRTTLCCGIGRAKGFGCGLLTVAPLSARE